MINGLYCMYVCMKPGIVLDNLQQPGRVTTTGEFIQKIFILERRIIYNYTKFGDSPSCIGEKLDLVNQPVLLQGFGLQPDETIGELLQIPLRIISNEECYKDFRNEPEYFGQRKSQLQGALYDGITDQVLCSKITCNKTEYTADQKYNKCVSDNHNLFNVLCMS